MKLVIIMEEYAEQEKDILMFGGKAFLGIISLPVERMSCMMSIGTRKAALMILFISMSLAKRYSLIFQLFS